MAQNLIICQFCEISKEIKWKCFSCDLVLCKNCADKHSKFGGSEEHCIIDLKQVGTPENLDIIRKFNLKNIRCTSHEEEKCSLFCKECKTPVCSFCVLEPEHKGHNLDKLSTVYNNQLYELKDTKERILKYLPDISRGVRECTSTIDNYNEVKQKIFQRKTEIQAKATEEAEKLIEELDKLVNPKEAQKLILELDKFVKPNRDVLKKKRNKMKERYSEKKEDTNEEVLIEGKEKIQEREIRMKETNKEIDIALQSHQASCVLATIDKVDKHLEINVIADNISLEQVFKFKVSDSSRFLNFGSVHKCPIFKVIKTYKTNTPFIHNLKSLKDGTLVFLYQRETQYVVGYSNGQCEKHIIKNETCVPMSKNSLTDMTVTEDDMILFTNDTSEIQCLNAYDKNSEKFQLNKIISPHSKLNGIHSSDHSILVGLRDYSDFLEEIWCFISCMILNKKGNCLKKLDFKSGSNYPFTHRQYNIKIITKNINGDIITIDENKVAIFDSNFKLKRTSNSRNKLKALNYETISDSTFYNESLDKISFDDLNDIVTTLNGLIVVADKKLIHVLSIDGAYLTSIGEQEGIFHPICLHIDKNGQLLVACKGEDPEATREKPQSAKIHVIKIID